MGIGFKADVEGTNAKGPGEEGGGIDAAPSTSSAEVDGMSTVSASTLTGSSHWPAVVEGWPCFFGFPPPIKEYHEKGFFARTLVSKSLGSTPAPVRYSVIVLGYG